MTETVWTGSRHLESLLKFAKDQVNGRKLRLFACACASRAERYFRHPATRQALSIAENVAEGRTSPDALLPAHASALERALTRSVATSAEHAVAVSLLLARPIDAARNTAREALYLVGPTGSPASRQRRNLEAEMQRRLLRDVVGNPFRPPVVDPSWRTAQSGAVLHLAYSIYAEQAFGEMPLLGDALEDAGCTERALLDHCRNTSVALHTRGCWVLDLLLQKE